MSPRISVLIPVFNLGQYLDEAVDSVLAQTCQDFEILIVDDGSTDPQTLDRLKTWDKPRTQLFSTPNQGLSAARNYLLERASGEFICALDADDRIEPTYFEKALAAFDADPDLTFVSCWQQSFGAEEGLWKQTRCDLPAMLAETTLHVTSLVRTEVARSIGGFNTELKAGEEDTDFWITLLERGHRGTILPEVLFSYRRRPDSMSRQARGKVRQEQLRYLVAKHLDSYRANLVEVLTWRENQTAALRRQNDESERFTEEWLRPILAQRREELTRLIARRDALRGATAKTDEEIARLRAENEALRNSMSWRVTEPLRSVWSAVRKVRGSQ